MRTRSLSQSELNQVVQLKQRGYSWLKIQNETKIPRRTAKNAYELWLQNRSLEELKNVRMSVATVEFQTHMNDLIRLAEAFVDYLHILPSSNTIENSEQILSTLWVQDMHLATTSHYGSDEEDEETDRKRQRDARQNQILFKCLQQHTREKVRWQALNEWEQAWDRCRRDRDKLRESAREKILNAIQEQSELLERIVAGSGEENALDKLVNGALVAEWQSVLAGKPDQASRLVRTGSYSRGKYTSLMMGEGEAQVRLSFEKKGLAEDTANMVRVVVVDLGFTSTVLQILGKVRTMRSLVAELEEKLYPVILRPLILYTRCDLCPVQ
jgi:hypothetical protein